VTAQAAGRSPTRWPPASTTATRPWRCAWRPCGGL